MKLPEKAPSMRLYKRILDLTDVDECYRFFQDLCSMTEIRAMEQRFEVATMLRHGAVYSDILDATGTSSATISRVGRALNYGTGALSSLLDRESADLANQQDKD